MAYVRTPDLSGRSLSKWCGSHGVDRVTSSILDRPTPLLRWRWWRVAAQRIADGQDELPFGVSAKQEPVSLEISSSRMGRLLDAIAAVYRQLGLEESCGGDVVFE